MCCVPQPLESHASCQLATGNTVSTTLMGQPKGVILGLPSLESPPRVSPFAVYSELTKLLARQISARCVKSDQLDKVNSGQYPRSFHLDGSPSTIRAILLAPAQVSGDVHKSWPRLLWHRNTLILKRYQLANDYISTTARPSPHQARSLRKRCTVASLADQDYRALCASMNAGSNYFWSCFPLRDTREGEFGMSY